MTVFTSALPIIEHLRNAGSEAARAEMLLRMPLIVIAAYADEIIDILRDCGDEQALHYVTIEYAALSSVRDVTGAIPQEKRSIVERVALLNITAGL